MKLGSSIRRRRASGRTGDETREPGGLLRLVGLALGIVVVGFGVGWLAATRVLFPAPPPPGDLFEVPDVRGQDLERAAERLDEGGLSLGTIDGLRHPEIDSGTVVGQAPLPGQLARPNDPVRVTLSLGPERRAVPDVLRLRGEWARSVLEATGFSVVIDSVEDDLPKGRVVEVDPAEGTEIALPAEIRMAVSLGPPRVEMPRLLDMTEEQARDTLTSLGLVVGRVDEVFRFGRDQGVVVEQAPPAETLVERGAAVRLSVGRRGGGGERPGGSPPDTSRGNKEPRQP